MNLKFPKKGKITILVKIWEKVTSFTHDHSYSLHQQILFTLDDAIKVFDILLKCSLKGLKFEIQNKTFKIYSNKLFLNLLIVNCYWKH